jgi:1,4-alpha-glucan branching enzyme
MIEKRYLENERRCDVTFSIDASLAAESASVVGDFNNWDSKVNPMKLARGRWVATVRLDAGKEYLFRYLADGTRWENDERADRYVPSPYGDAQNSAVTI